MLNCDRWARQGSSSRCALCVSLAWIRLSPEQALQVSSQAGCPLDCAFCDTGRAWAWATFDALQVSDCRPSEQGCAALCRFSCLKWPHAETRSSQPPTFLDGPLQRKWLLRGACTQCQSLNKGGRLTSLKDIWLGSWSRPISCVCDSPRDGDASQSFAKCLLAHRASSRRLPLETGW